MTGRLALAFALAALLAGCGGGGSSSSSDPGSKNYDPAQTTLKAAGLEACGEAQAQSSGGLDQSSGVIAVRGFYVAKDCQGKKVSPNIMIVYQFDSRASLDAGMPKIKALYPRGEVDEYGPLVLVATGPDAQANMAAVKQALAGGSA